MTTPDRRPAGDAECAFCLHADILEPAVDADRWATLHAVAIHDTITRSGVESLASRTFGIAELGH
jgi:hypothetical protein